MGGISRKSLDKFKSKCRWVFAKGNVREIPEEIVNGFLKEITESLKFKSFETSSNGDAEDLLKDTDAEISKKAFKLPMEFQKALM